MEELPRPPRGRMARTLALSERALRDHDLWRQSARSASRPAPGLEVGA